MLCFWLWKVGRKCFSAQEFNRKAGILPKEKLLLGRMEKLWYRTEVESSTTKQ